MYEQYSMPIFSDDTFYISKSEADEFITTWNSYIERIIGEKKQGDLTDKKRLKIIYERLDAVLKEKNAPSNKLLDIKRDIALDVLKAQNRVQVLCAYKTIILTHKMHKKPNFMHPLKKKAWKRERQYLFELEVKLFEYGILEEDLDNVLDNNPSDFIMEMYLRFDDKHIDNINAYQAEAQIVNNDDFDYAANIIKFDEICADWALQHFTKADNILDMQMQIKITSRSVLKQTLTLDKKDAKILEKIDAEDTIPEEFDTREEIEVDENYSKPHTTPKNGTWNEGDEFSEVLEEEAKEYVEESIPEDIFTEEKPIEVVEEEKEEVSETEEVVEDIEPIQEETVEETTSPEVVEAIEEIIEPVEETPEAIEEVIEEVEPVQEETVEVIEEPVEEAPIQEEIVQEEPVQEEEPVEETPAQEEIDEEIEDIIENISDILEQELDLTPEEVRIVKEQEAEENKVFTESPDYYARERQFDQMYDRVEEFEEAIQDVVDDEINTAK